MHRRQWTAAERVSYQRSRYKNLFYRKRKRPSFRAWLQTQTLLPEPWAPTELDFRGHDIQRPRETYTPWRPGLPINIGSGRAAEWCGISYVQHAFFCELIHRRLGWSGQRVRDAARALRAAISGEHWTPPESISPTEMVRVAMLSPTPHEWIDPDRVARLGGDGHDDPDRTLRTLQWLLWIARVAKPAWGAYMLAHERLALARDPGAYTSSMIVGEIRRLRGERATDYRGCSGCEYLWPIASLTAEEQDALLARAKPATPIVIAGVDGYRVEFGQPYPPDFDHVLVLGMSYEVRIRQSDYDAMSVAQRSSL